MNIFSYTLTTKLNIVYNFSHIPLTQLTYPFKNLRFKSYSIFLKKKTTT